MRIPEQKVFFIGDWRVSPAEGVLSRGSEDIHLEPKVAEVLVYLAAHAGEVVTREDLEREVWHGALVGYDAVTSTVIKLRRALHDNSRQPHFISTIPKRGYELIAPVHYPKSGEDASFAVAHTNESPANDERHGKSRPPREIHPRTILLISLPILVIAGLWSWAQFGSTPGGFISATPASVIVLPFENLSHDPKQNYLTSGMTDDLITDLSRTAQLQVLSSNTSNLYRERQYTPQELGKTLHIDYVLQGSIRQLGNSIRVNAQLVNAKTGFNKWGASYDRSTSEVFAVQHEITAGVVDALALTLTDVEKDRLAHKATSNIKAYSYFQEGQRLSKLRTREGIQGAKEAYRKAIQIDPGYGRAYFALGQYDKAISAFEEARERNPNIMYATLFLVSSYLRVGRIADAEWMVQELETMNPPVTISHIRRTMPETDPNFKQALFNDLRVAGLPD